MDGICGLYLPREIESKSAALLHAMDLASRRTEKGVVIVDTKKAQKLYDANPSNVETPADKPNTAKAPSTAYSNLFSFITLGRKL